MTPRTTLVAALLSLTLAACSSSSAPGATTNEADPSNPTSEQCLQRCTARGQACQFPAASVNDRCGALCGQSPSEAQLACVEKLQCTELQDEDVARTKCS